MARNKFAPSLTIPSDVAASVPPVPHLTSSSLQSSNMDVDTSNETSSSSSSNPTNNIGPQVVPSYSMDQMSKTPTTNTTITLRRRAHSFNYDRFIPARTSDLMAEYYMLDHAQCRNSTSVTTPNSKLQPRKNSTLDAQREEANRTYNALLRSEVLDDDTVLDDNSNVERLPLHECSIR